MLLQLYLSAAVFSPAPTTIRLLAPTARPLPICLLQTPCTSDQSPTAPPSRAISSPWARPTRQPLSFNPTPWSSAPAPPPPTIAVSSGLTPRPRATGQLTLLARYL